MKPFTLHLGDCIEVMRGMADNSVDSIVTDPPYHLTNNGGGPAKGSDNAYSRSRAGATSTGFMGQAWDGGDIAQRVELWTEAMRVLKPGGHLLAFSGTRTQHRMVCAIEDAGFEIRDQVGWAYGSGFPKSRNIAEHDMAGEDAETWAGWGTALKPAWEPICVARKPLAKGLTVAANVLAHGTGAINIGACLVPFACDSDEIESKAKNQHADFGNGARANSVLGDMSQNARTNHNPPGRWPANLIHDGSPEVAALFPQSSVTGKRSVDSKAAIVHGTAWLADNHQSTEYTDTGSAARFFYCAKASRADRNAGLVSGDAPAVSTDATMREREIADWEKRNGNHHPTVKPTDLMAYLVRLVTPPGGLVLDPFMGSGSTGKACMREEMRFIGIDLGAEYVEIARARIEHELALVIAANTPPPPPPQMDLFATCEGHANAA